MVLGMDILSKGDFTIDLATATVQLHNNVLAPPPPLHSCNPIAGLSQPLIDNAKTIRSAPQTVPTSNRVHKHPTQQSVSTEQNRSRSHKCKSPRYLPVKQYDLCWRCGDSGHTRQSCSGISRIFCSRCGLCGVMSRNCTCNRSSRPVQLTSPVQKNLSSHERPGCLNIDASRVKTVGIRCPVNRSAVNPVVRPAARLSLRPAARSSTRPAVLPSVHSAIRPPVRQAVRSSVRPAVRGLPERPSSGTRVPAVRSPATQNAAPRNGIPDLRKSRRRS